MMPLVRVAVARQHEMSHLVRYDPSEKPSEIVAMLQRQAGDPVREDVRAPRPARGPAEHAVGHAFRF